MPPKPSRRNINTISKVKVEDMRPLPEPAEEPYFGKYQMSTITMLEDSCTGTQTASALKHYSPSGGTTCIEKNFDEDLVFDSADDSSHGQCGHLDDSGSSGFGNSVASFMSWSDDVELETTKKVTELMNEIEEYLYEKEPTSLLKKEIALECEEWRRKFPHLRLKGIGIPRECFDLQRAYVLLQAESSSKSKEMIDGHQTIEEITEEIIAVHGSYEEAEDDDWFSSGVMSDYTRSSTPDVPAVLNTELKDKVKSAVLDQLFITLWSKVTRDSPPPSENNEAFVSGKSSASSWRKNSNISEPDTVSSKVPHMPVPILKNKSYTPESEINDILQVSSKPIRQSAKRASARPRIVPSFDSSLDIEEENVFSLPAHFTSLTLSPKSENHSQMYTAHTLPQALSLQGKNHPLTPVVRGYHSAADRRTRIPLNRRPSNANGSNKGLKPLKERHVVIEPESKTAEVRQVSAPSSPGNWNKHITLPPIENVDASLTLQGKGSSYSLGTRDSKRRISEFSPRQSMSTRHKMCLSPVTTKAGSVKIEGSEFSKLEMAKQLFEFHPGLSLIENSSKIDMEAAENDKQIKRPKSRVHFQL